jgi:hypothetical protein
VVNLWYAWSGVSRGHVVNPVVCLVRGLERPHGYRYTGGLDGMCRGTGPSGSLPLEADTSMCTMGVVMVASLSETLSLVCALSQITVHMLDEDSGRTGLKIHGLSVYTRSAALLFCSGSGSR